MNLELFETLFFINEIERKVNIVNELLARLVESTRGGIYAVSKLSSLAGEYNTRLKIKFAVRDR